MALHAVCGFRELMVSGNPIKFHFEVKIKTQVVFAISGSVCLTHDALDSLCCEHSFASQNQRNYSPQL